MGMDAIVTLYLATQISERISLPACEYRYIIIKIKIGHFVSMYHVIKNPQILREMNDMRYFLLMDDLAKYENVPKEHFFQDNTSTTPTPNSKIYLHVRLQIN